MSRTTGILAVIFCSLLLAVLSGPMASAQQPPNDSCAGALPITGEVDEFFLTFGATTDSSIFDVGVCGFDRIFNDVWYCYTATATGTCVVSTCQNAFFDTRIAVFNGCSCPADPSNVVSCNDNCPADTVNGTSTATFDATAGSQYLICIGSASPAQFGEGGFTVSCGTPCDPLPDAEFFATQLPDGPGIPPFTIFFNASQSTGTDLEYIWNFGDGSLLGDGMNPTHTYDSAGDYMVQLTVFDSCGNQDSQLVGVAVCDPLEVDFSWQPNPFPPQTIDFFPDTTGTGPFSYDWDFGDGWGSNVMQAQHTYYDAGDYTVVLTVTDACGVEKEREHEIEVIDCLTLVPNFTESATSGPPGLTVNFNDTTSGTGPFLYLWNFGDGTGTSDEMNPIHTFNLVGTYTVELTVKDVCWNEESASVEIIITDDPCEAPTAIFSWNETLPLMVAFNDASTGTLPFTSYTWSFGDGGVSDVANPSHLYAAAGSYGVSLTVTNDCGQSIEEDVVVVTGAPSADEEFVRGDTNGDGEINIADVIFLLVYLFSGGLLPCPDGGDVNDDGVVDIADAIFLLTYLFGGNLQGDSSPPPPFGSCGLDPTDDNLDCESFDVCQ